MNSLFYTLKKFIIIFFLPLWSCTVIASTDNRAEISDNSFIHCTFSVAFNHSDHLIVEQSDNGSEYGCSIAIKAVGFAPLGSMQLDILAMPSKNIKENAGSAGFSIDKSGNLSFIGYPFLRIHPMKYVDLTTSKRGENGDITLIGRELQSGYIAQGGPLLVRGISVFRITPAYYLSAQLGFEPSVPDATQTAVESELIKIVESIEITAPAATAISPSSK